MSYGAGRIAELENVPFWPVMFGTLFITYPIALMSALEANSVWVPLTKPVARSLLVAGESWLLFFLLAGGLSAGKNARIPAILQPQAFIEISEALAQLRGIRNGDAVFVRSKRGQIKLSALVTKRIRPLRIEGNEVHVVGLPIHWGFEGLTKPGHLVNTLTPFVGDANVQTPEFKAFLVDVQKAVDAKVGGVTVEDLAVADGVAHVSAAVGAASRV